MNINATPAWLQIELRKNTLTVCGAHRVIRTVRITRSIFALTDVCAVNCAQNLMISLAKATEAFTYTSLLNSY